MLDQRAVALPTGDLEVAFGSGHAYSFPPVVLGGRGGAYLTREPAFTGPVGGDLSATARYVTMAKVLAAAVAAGHVDAKAGKSLLARWTTVRHRLADGQTQRVRTAVKRYAAEVRRLTGRHVDRAAARDLLAYAQLVFTYADGRASL
jgi:hypothetical protein